MSGEEFMKQYAPFKLDKVLTAKWLWENEAVINGSTLFVSTSVYDCLIDPDTAEETFKGLNLKFIPYVPFNPYMQETWKWSGYNPNFTFFW